MATDASELTPGFRELKPETENQARAQFTLDLTPYIELCKNFLIATASLDRSKPDHNREFNTLLDDLQFNKTKLVSSYVIGAITAAEILDALQKSARTGSPLKDHLGTGVMIVRALMNSTTEIVKNTIDALLIKHLTLKDYRLPTVAMLDVIADYVNEPEPTISFKLQDNAGGFPMGYIEETEALYSTEAGLRKQKGRSGKASSPLHDCLLGGQGLGMRQLFAMMNLGCSVKKCDHDPSKRLVKEFDLKDKQSGITIANHMADDLPVGAIIEFFAAVNIPKVVSPESAYTAYSGGAGSTDDSTELTLKAGAVDTSTKWVTAALAVEEGVKSREKKRASPEPPTLAATTTATILAKRWRRNKGLGRGLAITIDDADNRGKATSAEKPLVAASPMEAASAPELSAPMEDEDTPYSPAPK